MAKNEFKLIVDTLESLGFWVYVSNLQKGNDFSYLSPDFLKIIRYPRSQLKFAFFLSKIVHPDDSELLAKRDKRLMQGLSTTTYYRIISKNGQIVWVSERATPIVKKGNIIGVLGALRDTTEATQVQDALRESEARFRVALQNAPIAVFQQDLELRYTWLYKPQIVKNPEEAIGKTDFDIFPHEDALISIALKKRILDSEGPIRGEFKVTKDGETHYFDLTGEPLRDSSGNIIGINCATMDITRFKTLENKLRESEACFRSIFENAAVGIAQFDSRGSLITANEAFCHFLGCSNEETAKSSIISFCREHIFSAEVFSLSEGKGLVLEKNFPLNDGKFVWGRLSISVVKDAGNSPQYIVVCEDVTKEKHAEEALKESQKLLQRITDSTPALIYIFDIKEGKCTYFNNSTVAFWGSSNISIPEKIHPDDLKKWEEFLSNIAKAKDEEIIETCFRVSNTEGKWRVLRSWNSIFSRTEKGEAREILVSSIDDTKYQDALQDIQRYYKQLTQLTSEISIVEEQERRKIACALHDLVGQPLAMAKMQLRMAQKTIKNRDLYQKIDQVCDFITEAIKQTRSLSIELSPPVLQELGFEAAIDWLVNQMNTRYDMSIRFEKKTNENCNLNLEVATLLYQAVRELLFNVIKHAHTKKAQVELDKKDSVVTISVKDFGIGFDYNKTKHTSCSEGFGLLGIRERLKYFGGKMDIESSIGEGTKVEISIPEEEFQQKMIQITKRVNEYPDSFSR